MHEDYLYPASVVSFTGVATCSPQVRCPTAGVRVHCLCAAFAAADPLVMLQQHSCSCIMQHLVWPLLARTAVVHAYVWLSHVCGQLVGGANRVSCYLPMPVSAAPALVDALNGTRCRSCWFHSRCCLVLWLLVLGRAKHAQWYGRLAVVSCGYLWFVRFVWVTAVMALSRVLGTAHLY
jgi:hypothetical protein